MTEASTTREALSAQVPTSLLAHPVMAGRYATPQPPFDLHHAHLAHRMVTAGSTASRAICG